MERMRGSCCTLRREVPKIRASVRRDDLRRVFGTNRPRLTNRSNYLCFAEDRLRLGTRQQEIPHHGPLQLSEMLR